MKSDLVLGNISDPALRGICQRLCSVFDVHYDSIDRYRVWLNEKEGREKNRLVRIEDDLRDAFMSESKFSLKKSSTKDELPAEPPKPSFNIFPKILKSLGFQMDEPCTSDCCASDM